MFTRNNNYLFVLLLLAIGFVMRFYAAAAVPLNYDEEYSVSLSKEINLNPDTLKLSFESGKARYHLGFLSILRLGQALFKENIAGIRLPFILFAMFSLVFTYGLIRENLDEKKALLALVFLVFSQCHIGFSRLTIQYAPHFFFTTLSVYLFFKALNKREKSYLYATGVVLGLGFLFYPWTLILLPVFFIFLITEEKHRFWLKSRDTYLALFLTLSLALPYFFWTVDEFSYKLIDKKNFFMIGLSLRSFYLYFGEILAKLSEVSGIFCWDIFKESVFLKAPSGRTILVSMVSNEIPFLSWAFGLAIFAGFFYCLRNKADQLIRFSLIMFVLFFAVTSMANSPALLDDHNWAAVTIFPGAVFCSHMLIEAGRRFKFVNLITAALLAYLIINSLVFISLPEHLFAVPGDELYKYYLSRAELYLGQGKRDLAAKRCRWVLNRHPGKEIALKAEEILDSISIK